jgi:WD40 repeat protein
MTRAEVWAVGLALSAVTAGCATVGAAVVGGAVEGASEVAIDRATKGSPSGPTGGSAQQVDSSHYLRRPAVHAVATDAGDCVVAVTSDAMLAAVSAGAAGEPISVLDLAAPATKLTLPGTTSRSRALAFGNRGTLLAVGRESGAIELVEVTTGALAATLSGHERAVLALAFSPDDGTLVSGGADGTVRLWDLGTRRQVQRLEGPTGPVEAVSFSATGGRVASGGDDGKVCVWDARNGKRVACFEGTHPVSSVALFPGGERIASNGTEELLSVRDVGLPGSPRAWWLGSQVVAVAVSPDGKSVAGGQLNGRVESRAASPDEWDRPSAFCAIDPAVAVLAYTFDGRSLIIGGRDGSVYVVPVDGDLAR